MEAEKILNRVFNEEWEHRMADLPMNDNLKAVLFAMEEFANLKCIEVLEELFSNSGDGDIYLKLSELKRSLPDNP